jgi:hypothetical protein
MKENPDGSEVCVREREREGERERGREKKVCVKE